MPKKNIVDVFGDNGALASVIDNYSPRTAQLALAQEIFDAISSNNSYVAEAPTGIGKTFAYLVPAILSGKKTVISTGTKNLQDQLFFRDLPVLLDGLKMPVKVALLKGRQNYICHYRLEHNLVNACFPTKKVQNEFKLIHKNLLRFNSGDRSELAEIAEDSEVWNYTTSTADNCLSKECPFIKDCFLIKARKKAQQAELVVINHHLFFADCALKEDGFGEILPDFEVVVFDEAHQLSQVATNFFGKHLSSRQFKLIINELEIEQTKHAHDDSVLLEYQQQLIDKSESLRDAFDVTNGRYSWHDFQKNAQVGSAFTELKDVLSKAIEHINDVSERSPGYVDLYERLKSMLAFLEKITGDIKKHQAVYWLELYKSSIVLNETPLSVSDVFQSLIQSKTSYIYTSATLSVDNNFDYFIHSLGLKEVASNTFETLFDYPEQSLMYLPRKLPDPNHENYTSNLVEQVIPIIEAFKGKTFFLFTSFKALHKAQEVLETSSDFNLFVQGDMSKSQLVDSFCKADNAVLLGTNSFWEGIDVRGQSLSCVIIDKLPFESPFDPVVQARIQQLKRQGISAFDNYQLPLAVIALKQGLGRLIRDPNDYGVLVVGDPRLSGRSYGQSFFNSLPEMIVTRDKQLVLEFIDTIPFSHKHEDVTND